MKLAARPSGSAEEPVTSFDDRDRHCQARLIVRIVRFGLIRCRDSLGREAFHLRVQSDPHHDLPCIARRQRRPVAAYFRTGVSARGIGWEVIGHTRLEAVAHHHVGRGHASIGIGDAHVIPEGTPGRCGRIGFDVHCKHDHWREDVGGAGTAPASDAGVCRTRQNRRAVRG